MIDFHNTEELLLRNKKKVEMLSKVDNICKKISKIIPEKVSVTIKTVENLSIDGTLELPLKIRGRMLGIGRHKNKYYTEDELIKAVDAHKGKTIPLKVDHRITEVGATIGAVDKIFWNDELKVIMYEAHVNDETHARNIIDNVEDDVSASIFSMDVFDTMNGLLIAVDLEFSELSIVEGGAFTGNTLEAIL